MRCCSLHLSCSHAQYAAATVAVSCHESSFTGGSIHAAPSAPEVLQPNATKVTVNLFCSFVDSPAPLCHPIIIISSSSRSRRGALSSGSGEASNVRPRRLANISSSINWIIKRIHQRVSPTPIACYVHNKPLSTPASPSLVAITNCSSCRGHNGHEELKFTVLHSQANTPTNANIDQPPISHHHHLSRVADGESPCNVQANRRCRRTYSTTPQSVHNRHLKRPPLESCEVREVVQAVHREAQCCSLRSGGDSDGHVGSDENGRANAVALRWWDGART